MPDVEFAVLLDSFPKPGDQMKDSFNTNFYLAAATVVPLFYITLFLQGQMVQNLALRFVEATNKTISFLADRIDILGKYRVLGKNSILSFLAFLAGILLGIPVLLILTAIMVAAFAGIAAEAISLWVLYYQSDSVFVRVVVLWSMLGLLVLIAANPTITVVRTLYHVFLEPADTSDKKPDSTQSEKQEVNAKTSSNADESSSGLGWPPSGLTGTKPRDNT